MRVCLLLVVIVFGCVEKYDFSSSDVSSDILVIEGYLSTEGSLIKLSYTQSLIGSDAEQMDADVILQSTFESDSPFIEHGNNVYFTDKVLEVGKEYRVKVRAGGHEFVSDYVEVLSTPEIDSLTYRFDGANTIFEVTTHSDSNRERYYKWSVNETWEYISRYQSQLEYVDGDLVDRQIENQIYRCWGTGTLSNINIASTESIDRDGLIFKKQLLKVDAVESVKMALKYSIEVQQISLSREAFQFWDILKKNTESTGSFFDPQPAQLNGNFSCITDSSIPVIGFLSASEIKTDRLILERKNIPTNLKKNLGLPPYCHFDTLSLNPNDWERKLKDGDFLPVRFYEHPLEPIIIGVLVSNDECVDCRLSGGTTSKPNYWDE